MSSGNPSAYVPAGTVYKLIDPSRRAPPGKCRYKPQPVTVKGKLLPFRPKEKLILETKTTTVAPPAVSPRPRPTGASTHRPKTGRKEKSQARTITTTTTATAPRPPTLSWRWEKPGPLTTKPPPGSQRPPTEVERGQGPGAAGGQGSKAGKRRRGRPREGTVRLAGTRRQHQRRRRRRLGEGRVEVYIGGQWGTICSSSWNSKSAAVVCHQLGYRGAARATGKSEFGPSILPILLDGVRCEGTERSLLRCRHGPLGKHSCSRGQVAGVVCHAKRQT
ncbi:HHIP-like protein 1 [Rhincodon typus]|uniref:HHIP-like protein 1 n=1 Tax=Rhincodon typus TaxID=259920 RepID=UPI00202FE46B|nr:HHIP-like protein 1 [Rhincodon typus]